LQLNLGLIRLFIAYNRIFANSDIKPHESLSEVSNISTLKWLSQMKIDEKVDFTITIVASKGNADKIKYEGTADLLLCLKSWFN